MMYQSNGDVAFDNDAYQSGIDEGIRRTLSDIENLYIETEDSETFGDMVRDYLIDNGFIQSMNDD